ncbi:MAG: hypothetical protein K0S98_1753 [Propionibacteriaceae bacterium]|nr:hypothetical protein [Propionibacteriaceae bacterium]
MKGPGERAAGSPPRHRPSPPKLVRTSEGEWASGRSLGRVAVSEVGPLPGDETVRVPSTQRSRSASPASPWPRPATPQPTLLSVTLITARARPAAHLDGGVSGLAVLLRLSR